MPAIWFYIISVSLNLGTSFSKTELRVIGVLKRKIIGKFADESRSYPHLLP